MGAAITVEGLGKRYRIGGPRARYRALRESLKNAAGRWAVVDEARAPAEQGSERCCGPGLFVLRALRGDRP